VACQEAALRAGSEKITAAIDRAAITGYRQPLIMPIIATVEAASLSPNKPNI
jgi:hypothetical protein